jgi:hypothetical protein
MLKIYSWLTGRLQSAEISVEKKIKSHLDGHKSRLFFLVMLLLGSELFILGLLSNIARFFIVIFLDSGSGFNAVFRQQELHRCKHSYSTYKDRQKKLRTYSFGSLATMIIAVGVVSLVMNLLFSDKLTGWAQTFSWQQTSWTTGASSTAMATHANNQSGWTRYSSSTANIATTTGGAITLTASSVVATLHTSDGDFNGGTLSSQLFVAGGAIKLTKPVGATCTTHGECLGGLYGTCYQGICQPVWITAKPSTVAGVPAGYEPAISAATCQTLLNGILVMSRNMASTTMPWASAADYTYDNPGANAACIAAGGRAPTQDEMRCIVANYTTYNNNFNFSSVAFWCRYTGSGYYLFVNGTGSTDGAYTTPSDLYRVRCVK